MTFYAAKIRQFWDAHYQYLKEQRQLFGPDEQPKHAPEEHQRRAQAVADKYDAELDRLAREGLRDARRINEEYQTDPSRERAWIRSRAALEFANVVNDARERFRNPEVDEEAD